MAETLVQSSLWERVARPVEKPVEKKRLAPTLGLKLFPDQQDAIEAIDKAFTEGRRSVIIQEPTGSGKTVTAMFAIQRLGLDSCVFIVHRDELVKQTVEKMQMINPQLSVGIVKADLNQLGRDLTVASAQTLAHVNRLERLVHSLPKRTLLIVDEAHHAVADTWIRTIKTIDATFTLGMTATAYRADKKALGDVFGEIVHHTPMLILIAQKRLKNPVGVRIDTGIDLDTVHSRKGDFAQDELNTMVDTVDRNQLVVDSWVKYKAYDGQEFKRPIAFCVTKKHAEDLRDCFRASGIPAEMVLGDTPIDERQRIYADFHDGKCVMTSVGVLTEGWDEPLADAVLMARPTKSLGLWVQMVGRVLRQSIGIDRALVMDFVDATSKHSLISLPTLAGHEAGGDVDGDEAELDEREEGEQEDFLEMCQRIARVRNFKAVAVSLFGGSEYIWAISDNGLWFTRGDSGDYLALKPADAGLFIPVHITGSENGSTPHMRELFDRPIDVEMARTLAEGLVPDNRYTKRDASWRERSATPKQINFARQLGARVISGMSSGEVSVIINQKLFTKTATKLGLHAK